MRKRERQRKNEKEREELFSEVRRIFSSSIMFS